MKPCSVCGRLELSGGYYLIEGQYYCFQHGKQKNHDRKDELNRQMLGELFFDDPEALNKCCPI